MLMLEIELIRRLFEPYIVQLMAKLLERFGDTSAAVRDATDGVARAVMANLSSQGDTLQGPLQLCNDLIGACICDEDTGRPKTIR